jgi:hypothetical protein
MGDDFLCPATQTGGRDGGNKDGALADVQKVAKLIKDKGFDPAIIFSFSRRCAVLVARRGPCRKARSLSRGTVLEQSADK